LITLGVDGPSSTLFLSVSWSIDHAHATSDIAPPQDPAEAHRRRGAAFTFDAPAFVDFVTKLRAAKPNSDKGPDLALAPSFAHELKDPRPDAVRILGTHRIVVFEGLYLLLSVEPWRRAAELMDERWFVDIARDGARERLIRRHVLTGVTQDETSAQFRGLFPCSTSIVGPW
jgi:pantothenate kinase